MAVKRNNNDIVSLLLKNKSVDVNYLYIFISIFIKLYCGF